MLTSSCTGSLLVVKMIFFVIQFPFLAALDALMSAIPVCFPGVSGCEKWNKKQYNNNDGADYSFIHGASVNEIA
jgi:hypothetical protein